MNKTGTSALSRGPLSTMLAEKSGAARVVSGGELHVISICKCKTYIMEVDGSHKTRCTVLPSSVYDDVLHLARYMLLTHNLLSYQGGLLLALQRPGE